MILKSEVMSNEKNSGVLFKTVDMIIKFKQKEIKIRFQTMDMRQEVSPEFFFIYAIKIKGDCEGREKEMMKYFEKRKEIIQELERL